jgi:hypothetical protein
MKYTDQELRQAVADGTLRAYTATQWFGVTTFHGQRDEKARPYLCLLVPRRVYDVTLDNNGGTPFRAQVDHVRIVR